METEKNKKIISYLNFKIGAEIFATYVSVMLKIIDLPRIPKLNTPPYIKGIINLRSKFLPIINSYMKFGLQEIQSTYKTCICLTEIQQNNERELLELFIDEVSEIHPT